MALGKHGCIPAAGYQRWCKVSSVETRDRRKLDRHAVRRWGAEMSNYTTQQQAEFQAIMQTVFQEIARQPDPEPPAVNVKVFTPFPVKVLPKAMADLVSEGAAALGCDPSQIALPMLAACSAAIGNSRRIMLKTSWSEPAVLWTVTVLPSGSLKSPAMDLAIEPIRKEQARAIVKWKGEMAEYRTRCDEWNN